MDGKREKLGKLRTPAPPSPSVNETIDNSHLIHALVDVRGGNGRERRRERNGGNYVTMVNIL